MNQKTCATEASPPVLLGGRRGGVGAGSTPGTQVFTNEGAVICSQKPEGWQPSRDGQRAAQASVGQSPSLQRLPQPADAPGLGRNPGAARRGKQKQGPLRTVALGTLVLSHAVTAFPVVLLVDLIKQHLRCFYARSPGYGDFFQFLLMHKSFSEAK